MGADEGDRATPETRLTRRQALVAGAAAGAAFAVPGATTSHAATSARLDFGAQAQGEGWPGWRTVGVANLRREGGLGILEAGSDVFPNDPRPVAFAVDQRVRDGRVDAVFERTGRAAGVVLRRVAHATYYAAVYDTHAAALVIARRTPDELAEIARVTVALARMPVTLSLEAHGGGPTSLQAELGDADGRTFTVDASDDTGVLQRAGDPGVFATAQTFLTTGEEAFRPYGNIRLGFLGTQEGLAIANLPPGQAYIELVRERSTAVLREIAVTSGEPPRRTPASVVAAVTGLPVRGGARVNVAADLPAEVLVEVSSTPTFERKRTIRAGRTGAFDAAIAPLRGLEAGSRVYWRPRLRRRGMERTGPAHSFRVLPAPGDEAPVTLAVGACASQFGPNFDHIAERRPDVFVWQGDLNYPDTHGPLSQNMGGYAGIWRDFLRNPRTEPILATAAFAPQRDDHDYGLQDANAANMLPWGVAPWEALMAQQVRYRFAAGVLEVWVLNERHHKSDPAAPDTPEKTLLGPAQRAWLLRTLAASPAPFKVICSPCTLFYGDNARDGNWGAGFTAERDLLLAHIAERVSGQAIFLTGDAHDTMVYDSEGVFEARACPLDIPDPRDHPGVQAGMFGGAGVAYADTASHFTIVHARGSNGTGVMEVTLVREDGRTAYTKRFEAPIPRELRARARRRRRRRQRRPEPRFTG